MTNTPLNYERLVSDLARHSVRYVLTGSVAAALYGVSVTPRDFDIAPELSDQNLASIAGLLSELGAKPMYIPDWEGGLTLEQIAAWRPDPPTASQLDHLLETPYGLLDVVPALSGEYEHLMQKAIPVDAFGTTISVAHPDDLLATLKMTTVKHQKRRPHLEEARQNVLRGARPISLEQLNSES